MTPRLITQHKETSVHWYALVSHYKDMHAEIYQVIKEHLVEPLYLTTPLQSLFELSPVVVALESNDQIVAALPPEHTIYLSAPSTFSFQDVLAQLRNRLHLQLADNKKGVFHFYLPSVASYFFSRADKRDTENWLGGCFGIYVYRQTASEAPAWLYIEGETAELDHGLWILTPSQEAALNDKFVEQAISEWAQTETLGAIDWQQQKGVDVFCSQYQITEEAHIRHLRHLVNTHKVALSDLSYHPVHSQGPETVVQHIEQLLSREYHHVS